MPTYPDRAAEVARIFADEAERQRHIYLGSQTVLDLAPHAGHPLAAEFARLLADQAKLNERAFRLMALACAGGAPVALADPALATPPAATPPEPVAPGKNDVLELYGAPAPEPVPAAPGPAPTEPPPTDREASVAGGILAAGLSPARVAAAAGAALAAQRTSKPAIQAEISETARQRKDRVLDAYLADPGTVAEMADRVNLSTPIISGILSAARQAADIRVTRGDAARREARTGGAPSKRSIIYAEWASSLDSTSAIAARLGMPSSNVSAQVCVGRAAKDPKILAGDKARLEAARTAAAPKATAVAEPPAPPVAVVPPPPAPAAAEPPSPRHVDEAAPVTPANIVAALEPRPTPRPTAPKKPTPASAKPAPEPLPPPANPVQARARAVLRARILDAYEETGDHPRRLAARLGATLREVDWFLHDARQAADTRVRLGDLRRKRQQEAGQ